MIFGSVLVLITCNIRSGTDNENYYVNAGENLAVKGKELAMLRLTLWRRDVLLYVACKIKKAIDIERTVPIETYYKVLIVQLCTCGLLKSPYDLPEFKTLMVSSYYPPQNQIPSFNQKILYF